MRKETVSKRRQLGAFSEVTQVTESVPSVCRFARAQWCVSAEDNLDLYVWIGADKFHAVSGSQLVEEALWFEERGLLSISFPSPEEEAAYLTSRTE